MPETPDTTPRITVSRFMKGDPTPIVSRALQIEDEFRPYYGESSPLPNTYILEPPYPPEALQRVCKQNNTLGPCIDAMETNIDGTGYVIEKMGGGQANATDEEDPNIVALKEFFDEVYPGLSFSSLRKLLRRDLEQTGNGYIEVLRNDQGQIVFLRHVASRLMRMLRLDSPIVVNATVERGGKVLTVPVMVRERRYVQMIGMEFIYFREFNSSRQIDYQTGQWESKNQPIALNRRGTEIIHLSANPDTITPYGVPRWEGQVPSALGSRKAEEFNLEYFETGGIPPALITVTGGIMTEEAKRSLDIQFNGRDKSKHRVAILEVQATGGSLDKAGSVEVAVERFGPESRQADAMFQKYDQECSQKIRRAFRLPALFTGDDAKLLFATAYTSYVVAESQVFRPERDEFDDLVNTLIMPSLGASGYIYRSKALAITDIMIRLQALQLAAATDYVDPAQVITTINELADLELKPLDQAAHSPGGIAGPPLPPPGQQPPGQPGQPGQQGSMENGRGQQAPSNAPRTPGAAADKPGQVGVTDMGKAQGKVAVPGDLSGIPASGIVKQPNFTDRIMGGTAATTIKSDVSILGLADAAMVALRKRDLAALRKIMAQTDNFDHQQRATFEAALSLRQYLDPTIDPEGLSGLASSTMQAMGNSPDLADFQDPNIEGS